MIYTCTCTSVIYMYMYIIDSISSHYIMLQLLLTGLPNVGKSSIINSLKRNRVCTVGSIAGVTK